MKNILKASLVTSILISGFAWAAPQSLGVSKAWEAIQDRDAGKCYIATFAERKGGSDTSRNPYITVTINKANQVNGQLAYSAGYNFAQGSKVTAVVGASSGDKSFDMVYQDGFAWAGNDSENDQLRDAMIKGRDLTITGSDAQNNQIRDVFSLSGVTASWNKAKSACN